MFRIYKHLIFIIIILIISPQPAASASHLQIRALFSGLLDRHERIQELESKVESAQHLFQQACSGYYPKLDLLADAGWEDIDREFVEDTGESRHYVNLKATQYLADFGQTSGKLAGQKQLCPDQPGVTLGPASGIVFRNQSPCLFNESQRSFVFPGDLKSGFRN